MEENMTAHDAYQRLRTRSRELCRLEEVGELLGWDQRTMLPVKGHGHRAEQLETLASISHERSVDPLIGDDLEEAEGDLSFVSSSPDIAANLREWRRTYDRRVKIPKDLAVAWAKTAAEGETAWEKAKEADDWASFMPYLERMFRLAREKAEAVGYKDEAYDALIEDFEPGETAAGLERLFDALKPPLVSLIERIAKSPKKPNLEIFSRVYPREKQEAFSKVAAAAIGFDFDAGRLDVSAHPFTAGMGTGDARITTRYNERFFPSAIMSTLHEAGHGIYEQGLPAAFEGEPRGRTVSLGIHESQSRLFENLVGRSCGFWRRFFKVAQKEFQALSDVSFDEFLFALNDVRPGLIRVEADEVTYNLHIILRFELERSLLRGDLLVRDLPSAWNEKMKSFFGIVPTSFKDGVMQDVHWSCGLIGYFPTYTLGNLYAAQLIHAASRDLGDLDAAFEAGEFLPLKTWLNHKIHSQGMLFSARDLVCRATGSPPDAHYLIDGLTAKYGSLYHL
jgi:carboxypeptidase Taq